MLFIISLAVCITVFFKPLYYFDIGYLHIDDYAKMDASVIKHNYDILIQYQSLFYQGALSLPDFTMSEYGRIHFVEVKRIFEVIQVTCLVTGVISALMIYLNTKHKEYRYLKLTTYITIGIPLLVGFLASLNFNQAFVIFHKIFFRNDYWIFDEVSDPVIKILPETFFMHCFMMIIVIVVILSLICYLVYKKKEKDILKYTKEN